MAKVLNTSELIDSVKKRASIPTNQKLFSEEDFIEILNEQLNTYVMPFLMDQHEEFLVNFIDIPLEADKTHYKIPERAIGTKIREVVYRNTNGNFYELSRISLEDLEEYQGISHVDSNGVFYLEGNNIVLVNSSTSSGSIRVYFYMQPNDLVDVDNGETISAVYNPTLKLSSKTNTTKSLTIDPIITAPDDVNTDELVVTGHGLGSGAKVRLSTSGTYPTGSGGDLDGDTDYYVIRIDDNTIRLASSFSDAVATIPTQVPITDATGSGAITIEVLTGVITTATSYPLSFTLNDKYDLISGKSPSNILSYDITPVNIDPNSQTMTFNVEDLDFNLEAGDYIYFSKESPVAQIPLEVQALLTQASAVYCLEAMGDQEGLNSAIRKQQMLETNLRGILNNRTEGSPKKVMGRHNILKDSLKSRSIRRF